MGDLPYIAVVDSADKFYRLVYGEYDSLRNDKMFKSNWSSQL